MKTLKLGYMKIILNDKLEDPAVEHEWMFKEGFGANVIIVRKDGKVEMRTNLTEVHNLYPSALGERIAFESDLHMYGGTMEVEDISAVIITKAQQMHSEYYEFV